MRFIKWAFCAIAISAIAYISIGSSNSIVSDNIEALSSGDANVRYEEHEAYWYAGDCGIRGYIRLYSGFCDQVDYTIPVENNPTCIEIIVMP